LLIPLLAGSLLFFVLTLSGILYSNEAAENSWSSANKTTLKVQGEKQELPENRDFVLSPIFKFIVKCNPFKKESSF
jgi:hypothetical protein